MTVQASPTSSRHTVPPEAAGQRSDRFLADCGLGLSRSRIKTMIEAGQVQLDGVTLREPAAPTRQGGCFVVTQPPPVPATPTPQAVPFTILHEDADLIVLDKPAGLVVHPAPGNQDGTLVNGLLDHCGPDLPGIGGERRPGIVHRLDKDTSGVMVVAKTEQALAALSAMFAARDLERHYLALCWGVPGLSAGAIEGAIGRDPRDRKRMAVVARGGKPAVTHYRLDRAWHGAVSLLECRLETGRTHQIRVHLSSCGHPLVGDPVYLRRVPAVAKGVDAAVRGPLLDFPRQALHAASLGFQHPRTGKHLRFSTDLPADMASLLAILNAL